MTYSNEYTKRTISGIVSAMAGEVLAAYMALKFSPGQSLESATQEYRNELALVMLEYLESESAITAYRNQFRRATNDAFNVVFVAGWADGGASGPIPAQMQTWVNGEIGKQIGYIDGVFQELKDLRKAGDQQAQSAFVTARADGYASTLVGIYSYAKMNAAAFRVGVWRVGPTEHCNTCASLNEQTRMVKDFLDAGLIPQQNGNPNLECGGWNCQCGIYDPQTGERIVP